MKNAKNLVFAVQVEKTGKNNYADAKQSAL